MNLSGNNIKRYILRRYSIDELESILNQKLNNQSRNLKHYADKSLDKFMNIVIYSITDEILEQLTDGWVEDSPIPEKGLYEFIQEIFGERIIKKYDELTNMNLQESIRRILREEENTLNYIRRRYNCMDEYITKLENGEETLPIRRGQLDWTHYQIMITAFIRVNCKDGDGYYDPILHSKIMDTFGDRLYKWYKDNINLQKY